MDNEASAAVTAWLSAHGVDHQKVAPYNHRANRAERAIETAKHHLLAAIASTDSAFPINQWDKLIHQGQCTLNMLRPCRINPNISAYTYLEGVHDYNAHPFPPPGWRTLVFEDPDTRASWAPHGIEGFSVGPAMHNYRCTTCWIPSTGALRTTDTVMFYPPTGYSIPSLPTPEEVVGDAARTLGKALTTLATNNPVYRSYGTHAGLQQLCDIINSATTKLQLPAHISWCLRR